ncbi:Gp49 family protein [Yersinia enterocolitica]|uniref:Gp49 family protein n=1 Tax=Yersinia enterocolitica TaxID=630 RepID=UPI003F46FCB1
MSDKDIEKEIQRKGLTAPRITPEHIERVQVAGLYHRFPGTTVIICCITLENGYTVTGESACASPENFDEEIGRRIAMDNAIHEIWGLEGYLLRQKLHEQSPRALSSGQTSGKAV